MPPHPPPTSAHARRRRRLGIVPATVAVLLVAGGLAGCDVARAGRRCRGGFARDATHVLTCRNGRWSKLMTIRDYLLILERTRSSGSAPATAPSAPSPAVPGGGSTPGIQDEPPPSGPSERFIAPSPERLAAGSPLPSGGTELRDEATVVMGSSTSPGSRADAERVARAVGASVNGGIEDLGIYQLRFRRSDRLDTKLSELLDQPGVTDASPTAWGGVHTLMDPPGDWDDDTVEATWHLDRIGARAAWARQSGSDVAVGIVDSGTALATHDDLNVTDLPPPIAPPAFHATHVAGLACGRANGIGLVGAAWGCPIVSAGLEAYTDNGADNWQGVLYAAFAALNFDIEVINLSLGWKREDGACATQAEADAVGAEFRRHYRAMFERLMTGYAGRQVVWTLAAGNSCVAGPVSPMAVTAYDLDLENVLVVQASNSDGRLAKFSNFRVGPRQIAAPGGFLVSPDGDGTTGIWSSSNASNRSYDTSYGTSMAAPIVAGIAALVRAHHPGKSSGEVVECLLEGARVHGQRVTERGDVPADRQPAISYQQQPVYVAWAPGALDCPDAPAPEVVQLLVPACANDQMPYSPEPVSIINSKSHPVTLYEVQRDCSFKKIGVLEAGERLAVAIGDGTGYFRTVGGVTCTFAVWGGGNGRFNPMVVELTSDGWRSTPGWRP